MRIINFYCKTYIWFSFAIVAFILCVNIELQWFLVPCNSNAIAINNIILALSYSYIAATIFHILVNYLPQKKRRETIKPLINSKFQTLTELFRLCKLIVIPPFDCSNKEYEKEEYCQLFSHDDLYEDYAFCKGQKKYERLENLRSQIIGTSTILLSYREYLRDEQFDYLIEVMYSSFINIGVYPYNEGSSNYYCNQDEVGACIFDLYEASRTITSKMRSNK